MISFVRVSAIAGVSLLAGCSSWSPSWDFLPRSLSGGANVSLTIESDPPGADAKLSLGPSCRTPCMIPVPADRPFTVNYSLNGYLPQVVQVGPRGGTEGVADVAGGVADLYGVPTAELAPNPVYAQLQLAPPPAPPPRKGRPKPRAPKQPPLR